MAAPRQADPAQMRPPAEAPAPARSSSDDVLATIERLAELHARGVLTDREFSDKKAELLARL
ncbi:SHOCT domain-containing protein [Methylobacterium sp. P31]